MTAQLPIDSETYFELNGFDVDIIKNGKKFISFKEMEKIMLSARAYGGFNALLEVMQQMERVAAIELKQKSVEFTPVTEDQKESYVRQYRKRNKKVDQQ